MKKITSLTLGITFLVMSYTGIILFIVPQGRVAYWSDWKFLGLTKTQYGDLHTTAMVLMLIFGILHIYYNWKPLVSYLKDHSRKISFTKKEFLTALLINLFFIIGTLLMIQPFKGFLDFQNSIKYSWEKEYGSPPYGHAEETKLRLFCQRMGINLSEATKRLEEKGLQFSTDSTLKEIARQNNITPNDVYHIISPAKGKTIQNSQVPSRLGRKSLQDLAKLGKIELEKSIKILKDKGVSNIKPDDTIRNIADELGITPYDVYEIIHN